MTNRRCAKTTKTSEPLDCKTGLRRKKPSGLKSHLSVEFFFFEIEQEQLVWFLAQFSAASPQKLWLLKQIIKCLLLMGWWCRAVAVVVIVVVVVVVVVAVVAVDHNGRFIATWITTSTKTKNTEPTKTSESGRDHDDCLRSVDDDHCVSQSLGHECLVWHSLADDGTFMFPYGSNN